MEFLKYFSSVLGKAYSYFIFLILSFVLVLYSIKYDHQNLLIISFWTLFYATINHHINSIRKHESWGKHFVGKHVKGFRYFLIISGLLFLWWISVTVILLVQNDLNLLKQWRSSSSLFGAPLLAIMILLICWWRFAKRNKEEDDRVRQQSGRNSEGGSDYSAGTNSCHMVTRQVRLRGEIFAVIFMALATATNFYHDSQNHLLDDRKSDLFVKVAALGAISALHAGNTAMADLLFANIEACRRANIKDRVCDITNSNYELHARRQLTYERTIERASKDVEDAKNVFNAAILKYQPRITWSGHLFYVFVFLAISFSVFDRWVWWRRQ